jgi:AbrB family looped-hinge helix DNA binding protein
MSVATLTSKGQITLPREVREDLNLKEGDRVRFEKIDGRYVLKPQNRSIMDLAGVLYRPGEKALSVGEMDEAVGEALRDDNERIRKYGVRRARRR